MSLTVSILQGGANSHSTTSEEVNFLATDFISAGVTGPLTNTSGVAPATGSFAVNAQGTPDMTVAVSAGAGYVLATPTSGNSQKLRVKNSASTNVTISANATGGTRYDWLYIKIDPDKAKDPASDASDVATLVTSRSTSSSTDNGTPPTYGTNIAVITVANGASSISNGNIADKRVPATFRSSPATSGVNQLDIASAAASSSPTLSAVGTDSNININLTPKGTGTIVTPNNAISANSLATSAIYLGSATITSVFTTGTTGSFVDVTNLAVTVTVPAGGRNLLLTLLNASVKTSGAAGTVMTLAITESSTQLGTNAWNQQVTADYMPASVSAVVSAPSAGSHTYKVQVQCASGTTSILAGSAGAGVSTPTLIALLV